jgi:triphosphatase
VKAGKVQAQADIGGARYLRAVLRSTLEQVLANASEIASGSTVEEHIHQLRVGLRRTRTALRELGSLDPRANPGWDESLSKVFRILGEARDAVTAARAVRPLLEEAGAPKVEWAALPAVDPVATVRDTGFQATLIEVLGFALQEIEADQSTDAHMQLSAYLDGRLTKLHERVGAAAKRFETLSIDDQHKVRKRLKRLRYLAEFVAPLFDDKDAKRYLGHLEPAQDALGNHVDVSVAIERFREDAKTDAQALFALGFLEAHLKNTAHEAHTALKEVAKARPFWKG